MSQETSRAASEWTDSEYELALLNSSRAIFAEMARLLHQMAEARYVEPLGGFDPTL